MPTKMYVDVADRQIIYGRGDAIPFKIIIVDPFADVSSMRLARKIRQKSSWVPTECLKFLLFRRDCKQKTNCAALLGPTSSST